MIGGEQFHMQAGKIVFLTDLLHLSADGPPDLVFTDTDTQIQNLKVFLWLLGIFSEQ